MKTSYLILASLAAAVVAAPESDCSERRDSREVCPISQRRMTPAPAATPAPATTPGPTMAPANEDATPGPASTPGPTMMPTAGDTPVPTSMPTTERPRSQRIADADRRRAEAEAGTATQPVVDMHEDWSERWEAKLYNLRYQSPEDRKTFVVKELSKYESPSKLDRLRRRPLNDLIELVRSHHRNRTPVEHYELVRRVRDELARKDRDNTDSFWAPRPWWEPHEGHPSAVRYAHPRGGKCPGGGAGPATYEVAVRRGIILALCKEQDPRVWDYKLLRPYAATARALQHTRATPVMHGLTRFHETNRAYRRRANGRIVEERVFHAGGTRTTTVVQVDVVTLEHMFDDPDIQPSVVDFVADVADEVGEGSAAQCRRKKVELAKKAVKIVTEKAVYKREYEQKRYSDLLDDSKRALAEAVELKRLTGLDELPDDNPSASYLNNPASPGYKPARTAFFGSQSSSGRGVDAVKDAIRDFFRLNNRKIYRDIVVARFPKLLEHGAGGRKVIKKLAELAQIDHMFSGSYDHMANLFVDFRGPNQHFGAHRNQSSKWAYYGEDVMEAAAAWIRAAVDAVNVVIKHAS